MEISLCTVYDKTFVNIQSKWTSEEKANTDLQRIRDALNLLNQYEQRVNMGWSPYEIGGDLHQYIKLMKSYDLSNK
jgi:hypothetical protein